MEVGAVASMRYVKEGIKAAKLVMEHTEHSMLAGEQASIFAISMGLPGPSNLSSPESLEKWNKWKEQSCQPNFRKNVIPVNGCGPYRRLQTCGSFSDGGYDTNIRYSDGIPPNNNMVPQFCRQNHDTISMAVIDKVCDYLF